MLTEQKLREAMCPEVCNIVCNVAKMSDICKASRQLDCPRSPTSCSEPREVLTCVILLKCLQDITKKMLFEAHEIIHPLVSGPR